MDIKEDEEENFIEEEAKEEVRGEIVDIEDEGKDN